LYLQNALKVINLVISLTRPVHLASNLLISVKPAHLGRRDQANLTSEGYVKCAGWICVAKPSGSSGTGACSTSQAGSEK
jgi:hypothetical protein